MMTYHYKENSERLNPSCSSRALSQINFHELKNEHCEGGLQTNKSATNLRSKQLVVTEESTSSKLTGSRLKAFINKKKEPESPRPSIEA
jgi:hypothetical protein